MSSFRRHGSNLLKWLNSWIGKPLEKIGGLIGAVLTLLVLWDYFIFGWDTDKNFLRVLYAPTLSCKAENSPTFQGKNFLYEKFEISVKEPLLNHLSGPQLFRMNLSFKEKGSGHFIKFLANEQLPPMALSTYGNENLPSEEVSFSYRFVNRNELIFEASLVSSSEIKENPCDLELSLQ